MRSNELSQHIDDNVRIDTQDPGGFTIPLLEELPAANMCDPVVEAYKKDVDRTLLRENLELTVAERMLKFQDPPKNPPNLVKTYFLRKCFYLFFS